MKIHNWHILAVLSNLAFMVMMVVFLFITQKEFAELEYGDYLLVLLIREGIILIVQISFNLLLHVIPKLYPIVPKEPK